MISLGNSENSMRHRKPLNFRASSRLHSSSALIGVRAAVRQSANPSAQNLVPSARQLSARARTLLFSICSPNFSRKPFVYFSSPNTPGVVPPSIFVVCNPEVPHNQPLAVRVLSPRASLFARFSAIFRHLLPEQMPHRAAPAPVIHIMRNQRHFNEQNPGRAI